jgi:hypothetical protein
MFKAVIVSGFFDQGAFERSHAWISIRFHPFPSVSIRFHPFR